MNYLIPIVIVALICAAIFVRPKIKTHPAMWRWMRIFWISFLPLLIITLIVPSEWPEIVQWAPVIAIWYIRGRVDQQYSFTEYAIKEVRKAARDLHQ